MEATETRICPGCKVPREEDQWRALSRGGVYSACRGCEARYRREARARAAAAPRRGRPLSAAKSAMVAEHVGLAEKAAKWHTRGVPWLREEATLAAMPALCEAANHPGVVPSTFALVAGGYVEMAIRRFLSDCRPLGYRRKYEREEAGGCPKVFGSHDFDRTAEAQGREGDEARDARVWAAMDALTPRERQIAGMRFMEDRKRSDVAAAAGITADGVDGMLAKARRKLRASLADVA